MPIGTEVEMITGYCGVGDYYYVCKMPDGTQYNIGSDYITVTDYAPYTDWRTIRANAATAAMQSLIIVIGRKREFTAEELAETSVMLADAHHYVWRGPIDFRYEICDKCGKLRK